MDATRRHDLEELWKMRKGAGASQRDWCDQQIDKIAREDGFTQEMRQRMINAVRHNDVASIKRFAHIIKAHQGEKLDD